MAARSSGARRLSAAAQTGQGRGERWVDIFGGLRNDLGRLRKVHLMGMLPYMCQAMSTNFRSVFNP